MLRDGSTDSQKNELKPWLKNGWCLPEDPSAEFVATMEVVLEVYHRPYDAQFPVPEMRRLEIGESLGLTRERVRQIESESLGKLSESMQAGM